MSFVYQTSTILPGAPPGAIAVAYYRSEGYTGPGIDMQAAVTSISPVGNFYIVVLNQLVHPGVGEVKLSTKNPNMDPLLSFNIYANPNYAQPMVDGIKKVRELMASEGMIEVSPGNGSLSFNSTDQQLLTWVLANAYTEYHAVGSCSIKKVVDERLRVIDDQGQVVPGLRVVDNSIIPTKLTTHGTSLGAMLIGKVGSRFIKEDWGL